MGCARLGIFMQARAWWLVLAVLAPACRPEAPTHPQTAELLSRLAAIDRRFDGTFGVYVKDLGSEVVASYKGDRPFYLASTVKVPFAVAVFAALDAGVLEMDQKVTYTTDALRDGSGEVKRSKPGTELTVEQLLDAMLMDSDNAAADMLVDMVGIDRVNQTLKDLRLEFGPITSLIEVRRRIYGQLDPRGLDLTPAQIFQLWLKPSFAKRVQLLRRWWRPTAKAWQASDLEQAYQDYYRSGLNSAKMESMGLLLEHIASRTLFGPDLSDTLLEKMKACKTAARRFGAVFPPDVELAQKTGTQHRRACNVGIAYFSPTRPVVMAVCTEGFRKKSAAERVIREIGQAAYYSFQ